MQQIELGSLTVQVDGEVVTLAGEVDVTSAPAVVEAFEIVREAGLDRATVECAELTYLDSSGASALIQGHRLLGGGARRTVRLVSIDPTVRRILDVLALDQVLDLEQADAGGPG